MGRQKGYKHHPETIEKIRESCRECSVIHHIDGNHDNNHFTNLLVLTPRTHALIHLSEGRILPYGGRNHKLNNGRYKNDNT